jgi:hypothetical protein
MWTLGFRAKIEVRALRGHRANGARATHSLPVALLAAVPGVGRFAYLMAKPLRAHPALAAIAFDRPLRKLPFRVYQRMHLLALTTSLATSGQKRPRSARDWSWLKPSRLAGAAKGGIVSLRPYRGMIAGVLVFSAAALAMAGLHVAVTGSYSAFAEFGPITSLKVAMSLAAGTLGVLTYRRFWSQPGAAKRPGAAGSFFWLVAGLGLGWLALDDYLQIHERLGGALLEGKVPLLNNVDDVIVLGYGVVGLAAVALFFREIVSSRPVVTLLLVGISFGLVMMAVDFFAPEESILAGAEHLAHPAAVASILAAFAVKYREVDALARASEGRPLALPRADEPAPAFVYASSQERLAPVGVSD